MLIGREREIGRLDEVLDLAGDGRGGLCILCGEPGIGKTRLADDMVAHATARGFVASWGRAWESGGAPAYWPWIELLQPLADHESDPLPRVKMLLGGKAGAALGEGTRADPARERFELFEAVAAFVRACARKQPLLLVFDDLHAADIATLELLAFVARGLRTARIAIVCTWRDAEARFPRVADLLARIGREGNTLWLRPLSSEEVAELIRHETGRSDAELSASIHALSDGNPLFIREMVHALHAARTAVPRLDELRSAGALGSVLSLVRGRLDGAGDDMRALLEVAAAIGRESELTLLAEAAGKTPPETCALLEGAAARGLIVRRADTRWAFAHALVREAFYLELSEEKRHALHHAIALALSRRIPREPSDVEATQALVSTLAHHALAALPLGDAVTVVRTACRAAAHARAQLAYEEATALLERALAACGEYQVREDERAEVALALGWAATEAGKVARGREVFREAAEIARRTHDAMMLGRAALGEGAQYVLAEIRAELVDVLREAQHALGDLPGEEARRLRARVLARLAAALTPSDTPDEPLALAREALGMTEGETDARTRIDVDVGVGAAFADFAPPAERVVVNERLLRAARGASDRVLELRALTRLACDHLERGDVARADAAILARAALASSLGHPRYQWQTPLLESMRAMPAGRFDACEAHIAEARRLATEASDPNTERCIEFHRFSMLLVAGRSDELRAQEARAQRTLLSLAGNADLQAWLTAVAATRLAEKARAAEVLRGLGATRNTARMERVTLLEVAVLAGARDVCERLYARFDPSEDANACWGPFAFSCGPPIARTLAMAAFALGRNDEAIAHCERALALAERMDADAHRAWVLLTWGEGGSKQHLECALTLAERLRMPEVIERARAALATSPAEGSEPAPLAARIASFTLQRDPAKPAWTVTRQGRAFQLKDVRGLAMLARLVECASREVHVLDLVTDGDDDAANGAVDLGDAGEVIDQRARDAYKARITELRDELEEAEGFHDDARADRVRDELEALTRQIAAAVGLGGRERRAGSAAERARVTVQRRVREAIKKIAERDPKLGRHLDRAVRTGTFCIYDPNCAE